MDNNVSVIIPCYNQAQYLDEAVISVLNQTWPAREIIIVDDGSTDGTQKVINNYSNVCYIYQHNAGLSCARNTGLSRCTCDFVVFLDSDDRLLPCALFSGLKAFQSRPDAAFVSGHFRYIKEDGSSKSEFPQRFFEKENYTEFLKGNYIGMHATVMYRREILQRVGGFRTSLKACEDYDLFLRISKDFPVYSHHEIIAEYRQHKNNMSTNYVLMLSSVLRVLEEQAQFAANDRILRKALRTGKREWTKYYISNIVKQVPELLLQRKTKRAFENIAALLRYSPALL